jgi:hypothetical protein
LGYSDCCHTKLQYVAEGEGTEENQPETSESAFSGGGEFEDRKKKEITFM